MNDSPNKKKIKTGNIEIAQALVYHYRVIVIYIIFAKKDGVAVGRSCAGGGGGDNNRRGCLPWEIGRTAAGPVSRGRRRRCSPPTRSIASMLCARPGDMQPARQRSSGVLKLGRYIVRCLTAQPDIWLLFLYKCGQLVAVNLHEPVARSVGILDELFQAQQGSPPSPEPDQQRERREPRDRDRATRPVTIGSLPSSPCVASSSSSSSSSSPEAVSHALASSPSVSSLSPDNDQYRGMDEDDTDDGYTDSDDEPFAYMAGRRFSSTGDSRSRRSSSGCGSSYYSGGSCYNSTANSPWSSVAGRRHNSCTDIAEVVDVTEDAGSCRGTLQSQK